MFDQAKADSVLERMHDGASLRSAAAEVGVKAPTFLLWTENDPVLAERYARAYAHRADVHAERIETMVDKIERGEIAPDQGRVMLDALKWTASKLNPRRYGDKLQVDQDVRLQVEVIDCTRAVTGQAVLQSQQPLPALIEHAAKTSESST